MIEKMLSYFSVANSLEILLFLLLAGITTLLIRLHISKTSVINLEHLVLGADGHLDEKKFTRFGAWVVSTWGFLYIMVKAGENMPEWYFIGYMGIWTGNVILDKYVNKPETTK